MGVFSKSIRIFLWVSHCTVVCRTFTVIIDFIIEFQLLIGDRGTFMEILQHPLGCIGIFMGVTNVLHERPKDIFGFRCPP